MQSTEHMIEHHCSKIWHDIIDSGETYRHIVVHEFLDMQDPMADPANSDVPNYSPLELEMIQRVVAGRLEEDLLRRKLKVRRDVNFAIIGKMLTELLVKKGIQIEHESFVFLNTFLESMMFRRTECPFVHFESSESDWIAFKEITSSQLFLNCLNSVKKSKSFFDAIEDLQQDDHIWDQWIVSM